MIDRLPIARPPRPLLGAFLALVLLLTGGCIGCTGSGVIEVSSDDGGNAEAGDTVTDGDTATDDGSPVLTGEVSREEIEAAVPAWVGETVAAEIDSDAATALAAVEPGATVDVFLGTWCSDSRREVTRFWRALDETGGMVPFDLRMVGVSRDKDEPADLLEGEDIRYVPTFVVRRDGREVGRVVESAPRGIEVEVLALLDGSAEGVISGRDDLDEATETTSGDNAGSP